MVITNTYCMYYYVQLLLFIFLSVFQKMSTDGMHGWEQCVELKEMGDHGSHRFLHIFVSNISNLKCLIEQGRQFFCENMPSLQNLTYLHIWGCVFYFRLNFVYQYYNINSCNIFFWNFVSCYLQLNNSYVKYRWKMHITLNMSMFN